MMYIGQITGLGVVLDVLSSSTTSNADTLWPRFTIIVDCCRSLGWPAWPAGGGRASIIVASNSVCISSSELTASLRCSCCWPPRLLRPLPLPREWGRPTPLPLKVMPGIPGTVCGLGWQWMQQLLSMLLTSKASVGRPRSLWPFLHWCGTLLAFIRDPSEIKYQS